MSGKNQHTARKLAEAKQRIEDATNKGEEPSADDVAYVQKHDNAQAGNVYEGAEADERQGGDITTSRFRPRYRKLTEAEVKLHDAIKAKADELADLMLDVNMDEKPHHAHYCDKAIDQLELAVMYAIKGLTA